MNTCCHYRDSTDLWGVKVYKDGRFVTATACVFKSEESAERVARVTIEELKDAD